METRANFVLIGSFTLAVIAAAFGFVLWFQSLHATKARSPIRIVFEGPATGLRNGGSVNFNGIRIGEVISVKLDNPRRVVALAMVENNALIRKDTLVGLEFQGLTGVAAISLKGGAEAATRCPLDEDGVPVLTADPNALQDVTEAIRGTLQNINRVVADNQEAVKNSLRNLETFTLALARNSERIDNVMLEGRRRDGEGRQPHARSQYARGRQRRRRAVSGGEIDPRTGGGFRQAIGSPDGRRPPHPRRYQPRGEQSRPQPDPPAVRRGQQQRRASAGGRLLRPQRQPSGSGSRAGDSEWRMSEIAER